MISNIIQLTSTEMDQRVHIYFPYFMARDEANDRSLNFRNPQPAFMEAFGPLASSWSNGIGMLNLGGRWDYWGGFRFKTEQDTILFKIMVAGI